MAQHLIPSAATLKAIKPGMPASTRRGRLVPVAPTVTCRSRLAAPRREFGRRLSTTSMVLEVSRAGGRKVSLVAVSVSPSWLGDTQHNRCRSDLTIDLFGDSPGVPDCSRSRSAAVGQDKSIASPFSTGSCLPRACLRQALACASPTMVRPAGCSLLKNYCLDLVRRRTRVCNTRTSRTIPSLENWLSAGRSSDTSG